MDWQEARRLAERPECRIVTELEAMVGEVANELGKRSRYHT